MAKITWVITNETQTKTLTSQVISFTRFRGRQNASQPYSGQQLVLTIRNDSQQVNDWLIGDEINIGFTGGLDNQRFWVTEVQYNDAQGTTTTAGTGKGSTATVYCDDWIARAGRIQMTAFSFTSDEVFQQIWGQATTANGVLPADMGYNTFDTGFFIASADTYTGTLADKINLNLVSEGVGGLIYQDGRNLQMRRHQASGTSLTNAITLQPAKGSSTGDKFVVYSNVRRIAAGQTFINRVTVKPDAVASQTRSNDASVTQYGARSTEINTVNNTTTAAANRAAWLANAQSNPYELRFEVEYNDVMQTNNGADNLLTNYFSGSIIYLKYVVPGSGVETTVQCVLEGLAYSANPSQTNFTAYLSPASIYQDFILDSTTQGVLDTNRLGQFY